MIVNNPNHMKSRSKGVPKYIWKTFFISRYVTEIITTLSYIPVARTVTYK